VTIAAGYVVYACIERPVLNAFRKMREGRVKQPALSAPARPLPARGER
jgi:hypothetical protein